MSAGSLENGEFCHAEVSTDGGASWIAVLTLGNGQDNGSPHTASASPAGIDNNPQVLLRLRGSGATTGDYCYGHSVVVDGTWGAATEQDIVVPASLAIGSAQSEEHTSELQSLMRISYAVFCLKKKKPT